MNLNLFHEALLTADNHGFLRSTLLVDELACLA
jgi:hypothetical protein